MEQLRRRSQAHLSQLLAAPQTPACSRKDKRGSAHVGISVPGRKEALLLEASHSGPVLLLVSTRLWQLSSLLPAKGSRRVEK